MSKYEDKAILMKAKLATDEDWREQIALSKAYFEEISRENDKQKQVSSANWEELREAWIEYRMILDMHRKYIDMILEDKIEEALTYADEILWGNIDIMTVERL